MPLIKRQQEDAEYSAVPVGPMTPQEVQAKNDQFWGNQFTGGSYGGGTMAGDSEESSYGTCRCGHSSEVHSTPGGKCSKCSCGEYRGGTMAGDAEPQTKAEIREKINQLQRESVGNGDPADRARISRELARLDSMLHAATGDAAKGIHTRRQQQIFNKAIKEFD